MFGNICCYALSVEFLPSIFMMDLEAHISTIPEMGGRRIASFLRNLARDAPPGTAIVELGCWLGAGTAELAMGLASNDNKSAVAIHVFDIFKMSESGSRKAARQGISIEPGSDVLPFVREALAPFEVPVHLHRGMLRDATWDGIPISVYIDDASKYAKNFHHCLRIFGPSWIPGTTVIVLMDFHLWKRKQGISAAKIASLRAQADFIEQHQSNFEPLDTRSGYAVCAAFRYVKALDFSAIKAEY